MSNPSRLFSSFRAPSFKPRESFHKIRNGKEVPSIHYSCELATAKSIRYVTPRTRRETSYTEFKAVSRHNPETIGHVYSKPVRLNQSGRHSTQSFYSMHNEDMSMPSSTYARQSTCLNGYRKYDSPRRVAPRSTSSLQNVYDTSVFRRSVSHEFSDDEDCSSTNNPVSIGKSITPSHHGKQELSNELKAALTSQSISTSQGIFAAPVNGLSSSSASQEAVAKQAPEPSTNSHCPPPAPEKESLEPKPESKVQEELTNYKQDEYRRLSARDEDKWHDCYINPFIMKNRMDINPTANAHVFWLCNDTYIPALLCAAWSLHFNHCEPSGNVSKHADIILLVSDRMKLPLGEGPFGVFDNIYVYRETRFNVYKRPRKSDPNNYGAWLHLSLSRWFAIYLPYYKVMVHDADIIFKDTVEHLFQHTVAANFDDYYGKGTMYTYNTRTGGFILNACTVIIPTIHHAKRFGVKFEEYGLDILEERCHDIVGGARYQSGADEVFIYKLLGGGKQLWAKLDYKYATAMSSRGKYLESKNIDTNRAAIIHYNGREKYWQVKSEYYDVHYFWLVAKLVFPDTRYAKFLVHAR